MRRRGPFQPVFTADIDPPQGAQDRIKRNHCVADQKGDKEKPAPRCDTDIVDRAAQCAAPDAAGGNSKSFADQIAPRCCNRQNRPDQGTAGHQNPTTEQKQQQCRRHQAAAQIINQFPSVQPGQSRFDDPTASSRHFAPKPRHKLPIATHPTMLAHGIFRVGRRQVFVQNDIADQSGPSVQPFEQIVT